MNRGSDVDCVDSKKRTPLLMACEIGDIDCVKVRHQNLWHQREDVGLIFVLYFACIILCTDIVVISGYSRY